MTSLLLGLTALSSGCVFSRLAGDLKNIEHTAMLIGRVQVDGGGGGPIYVAHFASSPSGVERRGVERLPPSVTQYGFFVDPAERYLFVAFQDLNGDKVYEPGEPAGALTFDEGGDVSARQVRTLPSITLDPAFRPLPMLSLDLRQERLGVHAPFARGEVTTLDNSIFAPERASEGMWTPLGAAQRSGFGIYFLEPYDPSKTPILFVHGMQGSPRDFAKMIAALDTTKHQAWVAYYPSGIRLRLVAHVLHDVLLELRERLHPRRVAVVAHSMGGLVARAALLELSRDPQGDFIHPFLSISTPYDGQSAAASGVHFAPEVVPSWIDMAPGSAFLESIRRPLPRTLAFYLLFGVGDPASALSGNNDGVVSLASQLASFAQEDAVRLYGYDAGHVAILADPGLLRRCRELLDASN